MGWNLRVLDAQTSSITIPRVKVVTDEVKMCQEIASKRVKLNETYMDETELPPSPPSSSTSPVLSIPSPSTAPAVTSPVVSSMAAILSPIASVDSQEIVFQGQEHKATDRESEEIRNKKATKSDDAPVPVELWNNEVARMLNTSMTPDLEILFDKFRNKLLRLWKMRLRREFSRWFSKKHKVNASLKKVSRRETDTVRIWLEGKKEAKLAREELLKNYKVWWSKTYREGSTEKLKDAAGGMDCIVRASATSYWEWTEGSRLFFWRWPPQYLKSARDGVPVRVEGSFNRKLRTQPRELDEAIKAKVREKLKKVRDRRYVSPGFVYVLTTFFAVPKGEDDIRMVYDASSCGVNENLWSPSFPLPTVDTLLRATDIGSWMRDIDIGECF
jgi:hypothetical protein